MQRGIDRPARHRRDQGKLVIGLQHCLRGGVVAVDGEHRAEVSREPAQLVQRVTDARPVGQVERQEIGAGTLPQCRKQTYPHAHAASVVREVARRSGLSYAHRWPVPSAEPVYLEEALMGSRNMIGRALALAGASVAVAAFASAPAVASSSGGVASIEKLVPASIKSGGKLTVAADATYAPDEFMFRAASRRHGRRI